MTCGAIIAAAGSSQRMGTVDKIMAELAGKPVVQWSLDVLLASPDISEIVIVSSQRNLDPIETLLRGMQPSKSVRACLGGPTRRDSVEVGVSALSDDVDMVLIHDAARPMLTNDLVTRGVQSARAHGAVVAAVSLADTIKRVDRGGQVMETLDRDELVAVQTPQVFQRDWLTAAYRSISDALPAVTDEASLLERAGFTVWTYPGRVENIKLTTPPDFVVAEVLLARVVAERTA